MYAFMDLMNREAFVGLLTLAVKSCFNDSDVQIRN
jgi:hypothetical protein